MYIQDWLTLKVIEAKDVSLPKLKTGDKIVYASNWKKFVWTYIWYKCTPDYTGDFLYKLTDKNLQKFYELDKKAKSIFDNIKDDLKFIFPMLKFITAKMNFSWDMIYIYFYWETRVDFREWLPDLRKLIWMKFFLYQVWARDRVRLHPNAKNMIWDCGHTLCCTKTLCRVDTIETKTIHLQNLQTQGIDRQKGVCWKLKCCLKFEEKIYLSELENYPEVWTLLEIEGKKYTIIWINVLSGYVFVKDEEGYISKFEKSKLDDLLT